MNVTDGILAARKSKQQRTERKSACADSSLDVALLVEHLAQQRLTNDCPFAFYFRDIALRFADGKLTVRGRVPTFYLKQILHSRLKGVEGVERIDDRVDVVSSTGLSSTRS